MLTIAVDAMGGDFGPKPLLAGALDASRADSGLRLALVGDPVALEEGLTGLDPKWRDLAITTEPAAGVVDMSEGTIAIARRHKDSSIAKCLELVRYGKAQGAVSAGSTSASVLLAVKNLGVIDIPGLKPAIPIPWPHSKGHTILIDAGATPEADSGTLAHFAVMGAYYARLTMGKDIVRVGLLSIGEERSKGGSRIKEAYGLIEKALGPEFAGMVEGKDLAAGRVDVVACDAFTGNIMLKLGEGMVEEMGRMLKKNLNWIGKLGALLMMPSLKKIKRRMSWESIGGAPLLGVRGNVVIAHGRSTPLAMQNAILNCAKIARAGVLEAIENHYKKVRT